MPSVACTILLAIQAASFLALGGFSPASTVALASPVSSPFPANSPTSLLGARVNRRADAKLLSRLSNVSPAASRPPQHGSSANTTQLVEKLRASHDKLQANAATMKKLASRSHPRSNYGDNTAFQQECVSGMNAYKTNFGEFQGTLIILGGLDKGLACYDHLDDVETLVKDVVNLHKDTLSYANNLVESIPLLAGLLEPALYEIKCLVDELLDATENFVDCVLNITINFLVTLLPALQPLLQALCDLGTGLLCLL
ncbi:hypothetical protein R3P38DRAFT_2823121 [Favolaschia claudopus]|uniref:Uncharacterized protein n=1 Tax=Favolaschia claudopus TaxID=2862362 RepID=A0AAW0EJ19_9AGAR